MARRLCNAKWPCRRRAPRTRRYHRAAMKPRLRRVPGPGSAPAEGKFAHAARPSPALATRARLRTSRQQIRVDAKVHSLGSACKYLMNESGRG